MESLRNLIVRHEGWKRRPYRCPSGHRTIGVGWNLDAWPLPPDIASYFHVHGEITDGMIDRLLTLSIDTATLGCREIFKGFDSFTERRKMALIDMCFNLGAFGLLGFKRMRRAIEKGDWTAAAKEVEDSLYYKQVPSRAEEIMEMVRVG
jgi:lysozyme